MLRYFAHIFIRICKPSRKIQYFRFGYNPSGYLREDVKNCMFGTSNLFKHFQAKQIIRSLAVKDTDRVLDFGCGSGYMTVEIAKLAASTVGVDINPAIKEIKIPKFLQNKLTFCFSDELNDELFDKVLISEVILSVPSADELLNYLSTLLKPGGRLVLVNGLGKNFIKDSIYSNKRLLKLLRRINPSIPGSYTEYENLLCSAFGNAAKKFLSKEAIIELFHKHRYSVNHCDFSPNKWIGNIIELRQLLLFSKQQRLSFAALIGCRVLFFFCKIFTGKYPSGFIAIFSKMQANENG